MDPAVSLDIISQYPNMNFISNTHKCNNYVTWNTHNEQNFMNGFQVMLSAAYITNSNSVVTFSNKI